MFHIPRRPTRVSTAELGVEFCDTCAEVTTAADRALRRVERTRAELHSMAFPR